MRCFRCIRRSMKSRSRACRTSAGASVVAAFIKRREHGRCGRARRMVPRVGPRQLQASARLRVCRRRSRSRRSARSCAASCRQANIEATKLRRIAAHHTEITKRVDQHDRLDHRGQTLLQDLDGFSRRDRRRSASAPTSSSIARRSTSISMRAARPVARRVRGARRRRPRARDRAAREGRALLQRRRHQGLSRSLAGTCIEARLEYRRAGALLQAGDRRQPRLLLRRRFRIVAGLRFPHRHRDLASMRCRNRSSARSRARAARRGCRRWSASPAPRTS